MKTRSWILLLSALALVLGLIVLVQQLTARPAGTALVYSDGALVARLDLSADTRLRVDYAGGWNILVVENGAIRVEEASCPDGDCMRQGAKSGGAPIICLPNQLSIRFTDEGYDGVSR